MKSKIVLFSVFILILDFLLLLFFGKQYSKYLILGSRIDLHSSMLLLSTITSFVYFNKSKNRIISTEILFLIALIYFFKSFFSTNSIVNSTYFIFRQFMIFGYGISLYFIIKNLYHFNEFSKRILMFIKYIGVLSISIQSTYIIYFFSTSGYHPFFERNYYSPIIIMGLFVFASYTLVYVKQKYLKHLLFIFTLCITFSVGHDSAFLGIVIVYISYLFLLSSPKLKLLLVFALSISILLLLLYVPSFSDANMQWRIIYWKNCVDRLIDNYFIFGEGFGHRYASKELFEQLNNLMKSYGHNVIVSGDSMYKVAPHNSFLTMLIHLGIPAIILLIYPLIKLIKNKLLVLNNEIQFLLLSLIGMSVFSFFNVILELPHSSTLFWLVYFVLIFKIKNLKSI